MASFVLTYLAHSTVLAVIAFALLAAARAMRRGLSPAARVVVLRAALLGPLLSAGSATLAASPAPLDQRDGGGAERAGAAVAREPGTALVPVDPAAPGDPAALGPQHGEVTALAVRGQASTISRSRTQLVLRAPSAAAVEWLAWFAPVFGAAALGVLCARERRARRFLARRTAVDDPMLLRRIAELLPQRRVRVTACAGLVTPIALGRSEVVLPGGALGQLSPHEGDALLAHEVAHLARRDPVWLALARTAAAATVIQPLQRLLLRRLEDETELAADAWAAARTRRPLELARCLERVATWIASGQPNPAGCASVAMARPGSCLVRRVAELCRFDVDSEGPRAGAIGAAATAALVIAGCAGPAIRSDATAGREPSVARDGREAREPANTAAAERDGRVLHDRATRDLAPFAVTPYTGDDAEPGERRFKLTYRPEGGLERMPLDRPRLAAADVLDVLRREMRAGTIPGTPIQGRLDRFVIEAPAEAPFRYAQHWFAAVAAPDLSIWKTELALTGDPSITSAFLPVDSGDTSGEIPAEEVEMGAEGLRGGAPAAEADSVQVRIERGEGGARFSIGPRHFADAAAALASLRRLLEFDPDARTVILDARTGARFGDVIPLARELHALGRRVSFTGSYEYTGGLEVQLGLEERDGGGDR